MSAVLHDIRYAVRLLVRQPGFTLITVLVLSIGIGANTAIFSVVDAVLLRPLPYPEPDRLVQVSTHWRRSGVRGQVSAPDYHDWHDQSTVFDALAAYENFDTSIVVEQAADYAGLAFVTPEFFDLMRAHADVGRLPEGAERRAGGAPTAVVSHGFWLSHLGGDRSALGKSVNFGGRLYTIVGVLPAEFRFPAGTDIWLPWWTITETTSRSAHNYRVVGRLKPGVTLAQAQAEMDAIGRRLEQAYPSSNSGKGVAVDLVLDQIVRNVRTTLNLLFGVVVVVLLIACANVSNLLLARAASRTRELGIRAAVGASRNRVLRQLVTESVLLAIVAGTLGVVLANWGVRGLIAIAPEGLPRVNEIGVDARVLAFAAIVALSTSLVFGLVPAFQASRIDLNDVLKQGGRGPAGGAGGRLRRALIVFETAAAVVLVVGAMLLLRSFASLTRVDMGFRSDHLLVADASVPAGDPAAIRRAVGLYRDLLPRLVAVPGVQAAAGVHGLPTRPMSNGGYAIEGSGISFEQVGVRLPQALFTVVTPGFFSTMGIPLTRGRDFGERDVEDAPLVAIVNDTLVKASFPGEDPLGHRIETGLDGTGFMTIVGVVADTRSKDPASPPPAEIYMPYQQHPRYATELSLLLRTSSDPLLAGPALRTELRALRPDVPVKITTMDETLGMAVAAPRFRATLLGLFAAVALVLAMAGIYGVVSFSVAQRTSELGLRMALGAQRSRILWSTVGDGIAVAGIGVAIGCAVSLAVMRVLESMLFGTSARDPLVFAAVGALMLAVAALASLAPAARAARVDPVVALRAE